MLFFKQKKELDPKDSQNINQSKIDLEIITKMNQEFALTLDLNDTLMTALKNLNVLHLFIKIT